MAYTGSEGCPPPPHPIYPVPAVSPLRVFAVSVCLIQVDDVNKSYPGRASIANHLDLLITLLSLGASGWRSALAEREALFGYLKERLSLVATENGAH